MAVAAFVFATTAVAAQTVPPTPNLPQGAQPQAPVYGPTLKTIPEAPGWKVAMLQGATDAGGDRFLIPNLDVLQPVSVMLISRKPGEDLTLRLFKEDFDKPLREASTKDSGVARFRLRTEGDLRIKVTSNEGRKDYQLVISVGDEAKVPVPSLFVPISYAGAPPSSGQPAKAEAAASSNGAGAAGASPSGGSSTATWIIAGSLIVIMGLLAFLAFRRKSASKAAALLLVIGLPAVAPLRLSGQITSPQPIVIFQAWGDFVGPNWWALPASIGSFKDIYEALTAKDKDYWPQYTPPGMPGIPTACVAPIPSGVAKAINEVSWTNPECAKCFEAAHEDIAKVLQRFEKLRRVNGRTKEVYDMSMTFGNGVAMVGGVITTAEWMKIRNGIKENMAKYYVTYDAKVVELTDALVAALQKVAACELKFFNNASWYDRYGFMFVTPVVERHRR